jgi:hypothetical protein
VLLREFSATPLTALKLPLLSKNVTARDDHIVYSEDGSYLRFCKLRPIDIGLGPVCIELDVESRYLRSLKNDCSPCEVLDHVAKAAYPVFSSSAAAASRLCKLSQCVIPAAKFGYGLA